MADHRIVEVPEDETPQPPASHRAPRDCLPRHPLPGSEVPVEDLNGVVEDRRFLRVVSRDSYL